MLKRLLTLYSHKIYNLPIIVMMPHSRCNCRCVMCDIWKANSEKRELSHEDLAKHLPQFKKLGVKEIVFSGGEALMHSNLWSLCEMLRGEGIRLSLLSTGLLLEHHAKNIIENFKEVIISLDGSEEVHDRIRKIPSGFNKITAGVTALKKINSKFRITARCVIQRYNFFDFENTITAAKQLGLDQISFLAADVSTNAFNRTEPWTAERINGIALSGEEAEQFEKIIERTFLSMHSHFESSFVAESPDKIRRIAQYYRAVNGIVEFPKPVCNAPWVSAVIESDGSVMPCFFHKPYGNIFSENFTDIVNSAQAIAFRKNLNVQEDPICKKCVCSLKLPVSAMT
jgi:MoaA/NifB/PqqE/SkfB family radical SAM enzyme